MDDNAFDRVYDDRDELLFEGRPSEVLLWVQCRRYLHQQHDHRVWIARIDMRVTPWEYLYVYH